MEETTRLYQETKIPIIVKSENKLKEKFTINYAKPNKKLALNTFDSIISVFIVAPLIVGCWRGTWLLLDIYIHLFPVWETLTFSLTIITSMLMIRYVLDDLTKESKKNIKTSIISKILRRIYIYFFFWLCIMQWRGIWVIWDTFFEIVYTEDGRTVADTDFLLPGIITALAATTLFMLRSFRNVLATPFVIILDRGDVSYNFPTRFKLSVSKTQLQKLKL